MKLLRFNHPSCHSFYMFGQYKKSTSLYNIVYICEIPPFEQATLHPQLTLSRTLSGATALSVCVGDKRPWDKIRSQTVDSTPSCTAKYVFDAGPKINQNWINAPCCLGQ